MQNQRCALHLASLNGHTDVMNALILHGADILAKDNVSKW